VLLLLYHLHLSVLRQAQVAIPKDVKEHEIQGLYVGRHDRKGQKVEGDPELCRCLDGGDEFCLEFAPGLFDQLIEAIGYTDAILCCCCCCWWWLSRLSWPLLLSFQLQRTLLPALPVPVRRVLDKGPVGIKGKVDGDAGQKGTTHPSRDARQVFLGQVTVVQLENPHVKRCEQDGPGRHLGGSGLVPAEGGDFVLDFVPEGLVLALVLAGGVEIGNLQEHCSRGAGTRSRRRQRRGVDDLYELLLLLLLLLMMLLFCRWFTFLPCSNFDSLRQDIARGHQQEPRAHIHKKRLRLELGDIPSGKGSVVHAMLCNDVMCYDVM